MIAIFIGSSPRMWGTRRLRWRDVIRFRFIPTHVGNTAIFSFCPLLPPVHPHACGEHQHCLFLFVAIVGSSPRMWGTLIIPPKRSHISRFIPTHVGNTDFPISSGSYPAVHPHACGEHPLPECQIVNIIGSSPRMWGTPGRFSELNPC